MTATTAHLVDDGVADFLERIRGAAERARDADAARELAHRQRNALVIEAVDAGVSTRAVAGASGLAQSRVIKLLSRSQDDD